MKLIDSEKIRKPIYAEDDNITGIGMTYGEMEVYNAVVDEFWDRIKNAPIVDAVPVVHGHWDIERHRRICSVCGDYNDIRDHEGDFIADSYCPNCGAEMDGEG